MNRAKTLLLLSALTALLLWGGQAIGGRMGLYIAIGMALVMNFASYWFSDRIVLSMYSAKEILPSQSPGLYQMVQRLAQRAEIPMPRLYIIPEQAPNAFATGRDPQHGVVAVTAGLLEMLSDDEVEGVIAHELGHIKHRDTLIMTVAATLAGAIGMLANMAMWGLMLGGGRHSDDDEGGVHPLVGLVGVLLAPITASLIQMAISRAREFMADERAARLTDNPIALANALQRIEGWSKRLPMHHGSPETAHLFIQNPFSGGGLASLFRTHPPTEERVKRLKAISSSLRVA